ncbi:MBL fold metallo-hydrolase [Gordonia sp. VNK21]|uniref:MBL fold metallo-hydrolase n=1 Tax=Gordonia sp. VNK21 TaxID=3382483 RepID=UPI0038D4E0E5
MSIEVTGHAQREAWASKVLPPVEEVRPGLWSIPVPIPDNPLRYLLAYAFVTPDGVALIDTGWLADDAWDALVSGLQVAGHDVGDVTHVAITHLHPDHFGLVPRLLEKADPQLIIHRNDAKHLRYFTDEETAAMDAEDTLELERLGMPINVPDITGLPTFVRLPKGRRADVELEHDAALDIPGWNLRAVWTPGHTQGHLCFVDDDAGVIVTGDHLLPRISPNVSTGPFGRHSPLTEYLVSLANTERIGDLEALPAHEYRFRGLAGRVTDLLGHHEERLSEIAEAIDAHPQSTAWEISQRVHWSRPFSELSPLLSMMALRETHAHLIVLRERGLVTETSGTPALWSPAASR